MSKKWGFIGIVVIFLCRSSWSSSGTPSPSAGTSASASAGSIAGMSESAIVGTTPSTITFFTGRSNNNDLLELVRFKFGEFEPYSIMGVNFNKVMFEPFAMANFEWAGQVVKHLEKFTLLEFDLFLVFRWKWFPWNDVVKTSLGIGEGLSLATGYPSSETVSQNIHSTYLNYLWVDVRLGLPSLPGWNLDFMIHHRSGGYGLVNGVSGGSNYLCVGISRELGLSK